MNIQQIIIEGIREQLFFNDYMVLPDFGGFVLKSKPAHFSGSGAQLVPPSKTVSFNSQFRQNDGILVLWLSKKINCTPAQALTHIKDFSDYCTGLLQSKRRLTINGIGFFYLDFENNVCFEPQKDANFLREAFGLGAVNMTEIAVQPVIRKTETSFTDRKPVTQPVHEPAKTKRNYSKLILPTAVATLLCSMIILVLSGTRLNGELRSAMGGAETGSVYQPMNYSELDLKPLTPPRTPYIADANGIAILELGENNRIHVAIEEEALAAGKENSMAPVIKGNYEVVLGCFSIQNNARKLVKKLGRQHVPARITGPNAKRLYVVSQVNFSSKEEALDALKEIQAKVPGAWIKQSE